MTTSDDKHGLLRRIQELEQELSSLRDERDSHALAEVRWQALLDDSPFGVVVYRPDGSVKADSKGMRRLFDLSDEEAEHARSVYNILEDPQLGEKGLTDVVKQAFAGESAQLPCIEYELRAPLDSKWIEGVFFPVVDTSGQLQEVVSIQLDVSDVVEAQEQLRHSRQVMSEQVRELDHLYDTEPVGLCLLDTELRFLRINDRMASINGVSRSEHLGKTIRQILPWVADTIEPIYRRVIETGEPALGVEIHGVTPADPGTDRDWLVSYYPIKSDTESVVAISTVVQDITEVKQTQEELKESQRQLRMIIDNADLVLWALDKDGVFTLSEGKALARLGLEPGEVVGKSVFELYADVPVILDSSRRALQGEAFLGAFDLGELYFAARYLPVLDDSGKPAGAIGVAIDISERRKAEAALEQSERRFRQIAENISEVFWLMDAGTGEVIYISPTYERLTGRSVAEVNSETEGWFASIHPEDAKIVSDNIAQLLDGGGSTSIDHRLIHKNGDVLWVSVRTSAVPAEDGRPTRITGITEDITEQKLAGEERRQLEAKVRQVQKLESLGILAGGIAHDFNNLLMGVLGNADLAMLTLAPESPGHDYVERIQTAAQRASELANQMLAYSGKGRFVVGALDLNRLVREMEHLLDTLIPKRIQMTLDLEAGLPAIECDASQIRQIVMNLLTNASEAIGEETGVIKISTSLVDADEKYLADCELGVGLSPGPYVRLQVSDTGSGVSSDIRSKMFDPFFTTKFTGRGLGLAAVLGIVQSHGAALCVNSEPGKGSTFSVLFPPSSSVAPTQKTAADVEPQTAADGTVLIVDDEAIVRDVAKAMLESAGYQTFVAVDGLEGVEIFERHKDEISLVLLDMAMPGLDGRETFSRLAQIRPEVRVVLTSGYSEEDAVAKFESADDVIFVHKPYKLEDLLAAVRLSLAT